jgi:hypothetical protein
MNPKRRSVENKLREAMTQEGVPLAVIDYVVGLNPLRWVYWLGTRGYIAITIAGFGVGAVFWGKAESIVDANAIARAHEIGGILFRTNFGISFLILMFAWIFAAGLIVSHLTSRTPRARAAMFAFAFLNAKSKHYLNWLGRLKNIPVDSGPDEYIIAAMQSADKFFWSGALVLTAIAIPVLDRELRTFDVYTEKGYLATPLFPWENEKSGNWRDAEFAELGCNHVTDKSASDDIIYDITLNENTTFRISAAKPVSGRLLDQLELIDAELRASDVPFQRWAIRNRNPIHPSCLAAQRRRFSAEEYERLVRLLRVGEFHSD